MRDDALAGDKGANAGTHLLDYTAELVSHNERGYPSWALVPECFELATAYPTRSDSQPYFAFTGLRLRLVRYLKVRILRIK